MEWLIIGLLGGSILLFFCSFFQKNSAADIEKQTENMSIQLMQEIYYLKKKVRALEEEYRFEYDGENICSAAHLSRDDVLAMYEDGWSIEDIAASTARNTEDIEELLANN